MVSQTPDLRYQLRLPSLSLPPGHHGHVHEHLEPIKHPESPETSAFRQAYFSCVVNANQTRKQQEPVGCLRFCSHVDELGAGHLEVEPSPAALWRQEHRPTEAGAGPEIPCHRRSRARGRCVGRCAAPGGVAGPAPLRLALSARCSMPQDSRSPLLQLPPALVFSCGGRGGKHTRSRWQALGHR